MLHEWIIGWIHDTNKKRDDYKDTWIIKDRPEERKLTERVSTSLIMILIQSHTVYNKMMHLKRSIMFIISIFKFTWTRQIKKFLKKLKIK